MLRNMPRFPRHDLRAGTIMPWRYMYTVDKMVYKPTRRKISLSPRIRRWGKTVVFMDRIRDWNIISFSPSWSLRFLAFYVLFGSSYRSWNLTYIHSAQKGRHTRPEQRDSFWSASFSRRNRFPFFFWILRDWRSIAAAHICVSARRERTNELLRVKSEIPPVKWKRVGSRIIPTKALRPKFLTLKMTIVRDVRNAREDRWDTQLRRRKFPAGNARSLLDLHFRSFITIAYYRDAVFESYELFLRLHCLPGYGTYQPSSLLECLPLPLSLFFLFLIYHFLVSTPAPDRWLLLAPSIKSPTPAISWFFFLWNSQVQTHTPAHVCDE